MPAAVVIFAYNRLEHLMKTLEALNNNNGVESFDAYIFADGSKNNIEDIEKVNNVRKFLEEFKKNNNFRNVFLEFKDTNCGLAQSVIYGVSEVFKNTEKVIVVEDDIVTSPDFLCYMDRALDYYGNHNKIWSISGYTPQLSGLNALAEDVYFTYRGCSWGWGTWKNRWEKIDWSSHIYGTIKYYFYYKIKFARGGNDLPEMLKMQMKKMINSWAVRWCFEQSNRDMLTVYPSISRVINIGCDGSGEHCLPTDHYDTILCNTMESVVFISPKRNKNIEREFYLHYSTPMIILIKRKIKRILKMS